MKNYSFAGLLVAVGCLASCGGAFGDAPGSSGSSDGGPSGQTNGDTDSGGGGGSKLDGGNVDPGPTFSFVQADGPVYVRQGQATNVTINIARSITPGTDIKITATSKPNGVTVGSLTIPPGSNSEQLAITLDESVPQVDESTPQNALNLTLQGSAEGASAIATMNLQLFVAGKPGAPDTTFAPSGVIEDASNHFSIRAVTQQSNGKILIGTRFPYYGTDEVIRLNADGLVDSTFADSGILKNSGFINLVTADTNGRILVSGGSGISRYTANGAPDTTFNTTGSVGIDSSLPAGWTSLSTDAVAVGQDDSIYIGGSANVGSFAAGTAAFPYAFVQIPNNGRLPAGQGSMIGCSKFWDNSDNADNTKSYPSINQLSLLPTGEFAGALAFAGTDARSTATGVPLVGIGVGRFPQPQSSCNLDPSYGNKGGAWYSTDWNWVTDAVFNTDGSVDLLASNDSTGVHSLVHIEKDGKSMTYVDLPLYSSGITRAPDGRYLIAGAQSSQADSLMAVAYYKPDLTPDTSIGDNHDGIVTISVPTTLTYGGNLDVFGMRAVYTPDGLRTVVVGGAMGAHSGSGDTGEEHLVVARIWN